MEYLTPMTVQDVIEQIGTRRAARDDLLRQVPAGQMNQPVLDAWTVRDAITMAYPGRFGISTQSSRI
jgi:hypothetical protein